MQFKDVHTSLIWNKVKKKILDPGDVYKVGVTERKIS